METLSAVFMASEYALKERYESGFYLGLPCVKTNSDHELLKNLYRKMLRMLEMYF